MLTNIQKQRKSSNSHLDIETNAVSLFVNRSYDDVHKVHSAGQPPALERLWAVAKKQNNNSINEKRTHRRSERIAMFKQTNKQTNKHTNKQTNLSLKTTVTWSLLMCNFLLRHCGSDDLLGINEATWNAIYCCRGVSV